MDSNHPSYELINHPSGLERMAAILAGARIIAVDLEADSLHHFREKICLLQIASNGQTFLIDPLAIGDLSPLKPVFSDPAIRKVMHGADYDIRCLHRDFAIEIRTLFDTELAGRFLGLKETGLEAMLRSRFQVALDKSFQKKDWAARPLPPEMMAYAAVDVIHLASLAEMLADELKRKGRLAWVEEECSLLCGVRHNSSDRGPLFLRVKEADRLEPRGLAILGALLEFRQAEAERLDRPPFKVLASEALREIARHRPLTMEDLQAGKWLSPKQEARFGKDLLERIHQALALPEKDLPAYPRREKAKVPAPVRNRIQTLKDWRGRRAESLGLEPGLLLNNALIQSLAAACPHGLKDLEKIPGLKNWQRENFGREVLQALNGNPRN